MNEDVLYVLVAVTGVESEPAAVAAIENLDNDGQRFEVIETVLNGEDDYWGTGVQADPGIHFP